MGRRIWWWYCSRCGDTMAQRSTYAAAEVDRDAHVARCPARHAPWELHISDCDLPEEDSACSPS